MTEFVFLTGMPGCGKTFWGKLYARHYHIPYIDLDDVIEKKSKQSIRTIMETNGEDYFRKIEKDALKQLIEHNQKPAVIAVGGGAPCFYDNLSLMKKNGIVVYIKTAVKMLEQRLERDEYKRPLMMYENLTLFLKNLLSVRKAFYEEAHYTLDATDISLKKLHTIIENHE